MSPCPGALEGADLTQFNEARSMGLEDPESWTDVLSGLTWEPRVQVGLAAACGLTENFTNNELRVKRNPRGRK